MVSGLLRLLGLSAAACVLAVDAPAQFSLPQPGAGPPLELEAREPIIFEGAEQVMVARGDARLVYGEFLLLADEVRIDQATGLATATGHVSVTGRGARLLADRVAFNLRARTVKAERFRLGAPPWVLEGESVQGPLDALVGTGVKAWFGEPGRFAPTLLARAVTFTGQTTIRTAGTGVGLGGAQWLPLPSFAYDLTAPAVTGKLRVGQSADLGFFARPELEVPLSDHVSFSGGLEGFSRRGLLVAPGLNYRLEAEGARFTGLLRAGWIRDQGPTGSDLLGRPIAPDRWLAQWRFAAAYSGNTYAVADLNRWSDSEVVRDFRPEAYQRRQQPDSWLEAGRFGSHWLASAFLRLPSDRFQSTRQALPEIRFELLPAPLGATGIQQQGQLAAGFYREEKHLPPMGAFLRDEENGFLRAVVPGRPDPRDAVSGFRAEALYALRRPTVLGAYGTITPVAGARATFARVTGAAAGGYVDPNLPGTGFRSRSADSRVAWEAGFEARLFPLTGTWNYDAPAWRINGLRHRIEPFVSYRWHDSSKDDGLLAPLTGTQRPTTYQAPFGLADRLGFDLPVSAHWGRWGVTQVMQTRDPTFGARELGRLTIGQDWIDPEGPGAASSDVFLEATATPATWLELALFARAEHRSARWNELNPRLTLRDGRWWQLTLAHHYLRDGFWLETPRYRQSAALFDFRLNEAWSLRALARFDHDRRRWNEQQFSLLQNVSNLWRIEYRVTVREGARREGYANFAIGVELLRF